MKIFSSGKVLRGRRTLCTPNRKKRSMTEKDLPRCLSHAGDLALVGQLTEADTADAVVTQVGMGTAADLAAVVVAGG